MSQRKGARDNQHHIQLRRGGLGNYAIMPGDPGRVEEICKHLNNSHFVMRNREYTTWVGRYKTTRVTVISTGIGCPSTAICVEELMRVGIHTMIRVGTAGSLQREVKIGDLTISTAAVRDEGTTRAFVPEIYPAVADLDVTVALRQAAAGRKYPYHVGITHTKDAFYSEGSSALVPLRARNDAMWKVWHDARVLSTSMEGAAIFVLGSINRLRTGEVLLNVGSTIDDKPIVKGYDPESAILTALDAVDILAAADNAR